MITQRRLEIRVGAIVVTAALVAVVGTMWFQQIRPGEAAWPVHVRFDQVGGLVPGDPVQVDGVVLGEVTRVVPAPRGVVVTLGIREGTVLPADSRVAIQSVGIMGERYIAVTRGRAARALAPGDTVSGEFLMGMSEVMGAAGDIVIRLQHTLDAMAQTLDALGGDGTLERAVADLGVTASRLRALAEGTDPRLDTTLSRLGHAAALLDSLLSRHYAGLDTSLATMASAGADVSRAGEDLAAVARDLRELSESLRRGEGTAGRLLRDGDLAERIEATVSRVDSLVLDMRRHPGRYVTFKLF